ncbi:MAG: N-formylglutamate amidohydrolase [Proteobacteria bacterium]|nr:N-formylglutamate amidohydrolase [Pseudomonadota bacterium]
MQGPPPPVNGTKVFDILAPAAQGVPLVVASPHSGSEYPPEFLASSRLGPLALRKSEDCFIDRIFGAAPALGAPLLRARFPRAYIDVNREPFELDPSMFEDELPTFVNASSPRVAAGLGTIAKVVASGEFIYGRKLCFAEAEARAERCYRPYHAALKELVEATRARFGCCLLLDCHSMPSVGGMTEEDGEARREADFVLGNCFGTSCAAAVVETAERTLAGLGYRVTRNAPYAGGYITRTYGQPADGLHALQVEVNRALYMDEETLEPTANLPRLAEHAGRLMLVLAAACRGLPRVP